jgi:hypothetical protein
MVNDAEADRDARLLRQEAEGLAVERRAEAEKEEAVGLANARAKAFRARLAARSLGWRDELALLLPLLGESSPKEALDGYAARRRAALERARELADFRLYWESLTTSLTGRPKMLIDAERLPVRRTLWLLPAAPPPMPAPLPRRPRGTLEPPAEEP